MCLQPPGLCFQLNSCGLVIKKTSKEDDGEWGCKMLVKSSNFDSQPVEKVALLRIREKITNLFGLGKSSKKTLHLDLELMLAPALGPRLDREYFILKTCRIRGKYNYKKAKS